MAPDPLQAEKDAAADALVADAGSDPDRARRLVDAYARIAAQEALEVVAGAAEVATGVLDSRVARVRRLVDALPADERFPSTYEIAAIFKITDAQAQNVIRTYRARHPAAYRARMTAGVKAATVEARTVDRHELWVFDFGDPDTLDYAYDLLRARGLTKGVERDRSAQTLTVPRTSKDRGGRTAVQILGSKRR
jgi:hypothetical protein